MRTGDALRVEPESNGPRGSAGGKLDEDAVHDGGLGLVDLPTAADQLATCVVLADDVVTETQSAAGPSLAHPALQTTANFLREIFQEERVHRALESHVQLGDLALGQREQAHTGEAQPLK